MATQSKAALLGHLVEQLMPAGGDGTMDTYRRQFDLALKMMDSSLRQPQSENDILASLEKELRDRGQGHEFTRLSEMHMRGMVPRMSAAVRPAVLSFLLRVSKDVLEETSQDTVSLGRARPSLMASVLGQEPLQSSRTGTGPTSLENSLHLPARGLREVATSGGAKGGQIMAPPRGGALLAAARMENIDFGVPEETLVKSVIYAIQGISTQYGRWIEKERDFEMDAESGIPKTQRAVMRQMFELGWLYKKVQGHAYGHDAEKGEKAALGAVRQAFCSALQAELAEYFRLIANLEARAQFPIPGAWETPQQQQAASAPYLTLRRLQLALAAPMRILRTLASLADTVAALKGGQLASAIYACAQHGDPFHHQLVSRVLTAVCSPIYDMLQRWILEGHLDDPFGEFFIARNSSQKGDDDLWRAGYVLLHEQLPPMVDPELAAAILRCGKSIIFLRECCGDSSWAPWGGSGARAVAKLEYGQAKVLEQTVKQACENANSRLITVLFDRYDFFLHCDAIRRYMLTAQGDFISYLMDSIKETLNEPAAVLTKSDYTIAGKLEAAIRASNAQYDDPKVLDCLGVTCNKAVSPGGQQGWDVFTMVYHVGAPLDTIFTPSAMMSYTRIFKLLWDIKHVEHALAGAWHTAKPNNRQNRAVRGGASAAAHGHDMRLCMCLRSEMSHFITNLQYYFVFEVLEGTRDSFIEQARAARDLDELIAAHEAYLQRSIRKSLLDQESQGLHGILYQLFRDMHKFSLLVERFHEAAESADSIAQLRGGARDGNRGILEQEFKRDLESIKATYQNHMNNFVALLPSQAHVDLRFLKFRLDFTDFYAQGLDDESDDSAPNTPS